MVRVVALLLAFGLLCGCGEPDEETAPIVAGPCAVGDVVSATGACCAPGTLAQADGSCLPAGITTCSPGFIADGVGGCLPVLPSAPCPPGTMEVLGQEACAPVMDCGSGRWGQIPVDASTIYVDGAVSPGGNGGEQSPFSRIQEAIDAAPAGALIAVTDGTYAEDLNIAAPVRVWGRCPERVGVVGQGAVAAVLINSGGVELGGVGISGPTIGVVASNALDVVLDRLWVHDLGGRGIDFEATLGPTAGTIRGSLVERATDAAVIALSSEMTVEDCVLRDTQPGGSTGGGRGAAARRLPGNATRAALTLARTVVARSSDHGVFVDVSDVTMTDSVVVDTAANPTDGYFGRGVSLQADAVTPDGSTGIITGSYIGRSHDSGVWIDGSTATIERTVVMDTLPMAATQEVGIGINAQDGPASVPSVVTLRQSLVALSRYAGVSILGSQLTLESTIVRDTLPGTAQMITGGPGAIPVSGTGLALQSDVVSGQQVTATVRGSVIERSVAFGVFVQGGTASFDATAVRVTAAAPDGRFGFGLQVNEDPLTQIRANVTLSSCAFEQATQGGLYLLGSDVSLANVVVRDVAPRALGMTGGVGIGVAASPLMGLPANVLGSDLLVERARMVGISVQESELTLERVVVRDTLAQESDGSFGDGLVAFRGTLSVADSEITNAARAGIASFGGTVSLSGSRLECNPIQLNSEELVGPATFEDAGDNHCGCGEAEEVCKASSSQLSPPPPLEDAPGG